MTVFPFILVHMDKKKQEMKRGISCQFAFKQTEEDNDLLCAHNLSFIYIRMESLSVGCHLSGVCLGAQEIEAWQRMKKQPASLFIDIKQLQDLDQLICLFFTFKLGFKTLTKISSPFRVINGKTSATS